MNRYRVLKAPEGWPKQLPFAVQTTDGSYGPGDEFDHEFSEEDEAANLASGLLEIVPRSYKVIGDSVVHDTEPGETFERGLTIGVEGLLFAGGHIERVDVPVVPAVAKPPTPRKTKEK